MYVNVHGYAYPPPSTYTYLWLALALSHQVGVVKYASARGVACAEDTRDVDALGTAADPRLLLGAAVDRRDDGRSTPRVDIALSP
jgi:hypothetical protein